MIPSMHSGTGAQLRPLLLALLLALPVRLYLATSASMLSRDGVTFIWYAQDLAGGPLEEIRDQKQHPLYPVLVLGAHTAIERIPGLDDPVLTWTLAGVLVTLVGGLAVVVGVYCLALQLFNRRVALLAAVLAALAAEFCQLSADALTDMPHLALYLFSLCAAGLGLRYLSDPFPDAAAPAWTPAGVSTSTKVRSPLERRGYTWLFVAGVLSGLAYLMRPEGGEAGLAAAAGAVVILRGAPLRRRATAALAVCAGVALLASPYMLATGKLVQKKDVLRLIGSAPDGEREYNAAANEGSGETKPEQVAGSSLLGEANEATVTLPMVRAPSGPCHPCLHDAASLASSAPAVHRLVRAVLIVLEHWSRALRVALTLPLLVWFLLRRRLAAEPTAGRLVAGAAVLHVVVALALILRFDYGDLFSVRHTMILAGLTLPFTSAGIIALAGLLPPSRRRATELLLAVILVGTTAPWMLERRYAQELYLRRAGEWIRAQQPAGAKVHTPRHTVVFYANGTWQWSPREEEADIDRVLIEARTWRPDYLVFDERRTLRAAPGFFERLESQLRPGEQLARVHVEEQTAKGARQRAIVYRYTPPP